MAWLKNILHPEYYQGGRRRDAYFEGWYYKMVSADERHTVALIPGVSLSRDDSHAFIQAFVSRRTERGVDLRTDYHRFPLSAFRTAPDAFELGIAANAFSGRRLTILLASAKMTLSGTVALADLAPIRKTFLQPNIMGVFGYFSFMECYHGIVSMTHKLSGSLLLDGEPIVFDGGKGYLEKDWGQSFPRSYVWLQSNHFADPSASFMFSYADIPFLGLHFRGLIANLVVSGREYRFATYNGTRVRNAEEAAGRVFYRLNKRGYVLDVEARSDLQVGLASPRKGRMIEEIKEGLSGTIRIRLARKGTVLFEGTGAHAGIEIMTGQSPR